jgi:predicted nucleic acid-binding protein
LSFYLDASAILPLLVLEQTSEAIERFVSATAEPLVVSDFAAAEIAAALSRLLRTGVRTEMAAGQRLALFDVWRDADTVYADITAADHRLASLFVRRFDLMLRAPDALYAAICARLGLTLVTLDHRLAAAAPPWA